MLTLVTCLLLLVSGVHRGAAQLQEKNDATEGPLPKVEKEVRPADRFLVLSRSRAVGARSGGTVLTIPKVSSPITKLQLNVTVGGFSCQLLLWNTSHVACMTRRAGLTSVDVPQSVQVSFNGVTQKRGTFTYKPDPIVYDIDPTETTLSAGRTLTVRGARFDVIQTVILQVTLVYKGRRGRTFKSLCTISSPERLLCPTPEFDILNDKGLLDERLITQNLDKEAIHLEDSLYMQSRGRRRRKANSGGQVGGGDLLFCLGLLLDGVKEYVNLSKTLPNDDKLTVYYNPVVHTWDNNKVVTPDKRVLEISGERLMTGISMADYRVTIGQSDCGVLALFNNRLVCEAPLSPPPSNHSDNRLHVMVHIGLYLTPFYVGQVQYKTPLQDNPAALWGLTAAGVVTSILLGTALGVCLPRLCRTRRGKSKENKPPSPTFRDRLFPRLTRSTPPIYPGAFPF